MAFSAPGVVEAFPVPRSAAWIMRHLIRGAYARSVDGAWSGWFRYEADGSYTLASLEDVSAARLAALGVRMVGDMMAVDQLSHGSISFAASTGPRPGVDVYVTGLDGERDPGETGYCFVPLEAWEAVVEHVSEGLYPPIEDVPLATSERGPCRLEQVVAWLKRGWSR